MCGIRTDEDELGSSWAWEGAGRSLGGSIWALWGDELALKAVSGLYWSWISGILGGSFFVHSVVWSSSWG